MTGYDFFFFFFYFLWILQFVFMSVPTTSVLTVNIGDNVKFRFGGI